MKRAARTDANHKEIVNLLRETGHSVLDLSRVGHGCPDLLCYRNGRTFLAEIKDGEKSPSRRKLTGQQVKFHQHWKGPILIIQSKEDIIDLC